MSDSVDIDSRDMRLLAADLTAAPTKVQLACDAQLEISAKRIQAGMKADATGHKALPDLQNHVSYDRLGSGLEYEIGFDKVGQGSLANIGAFGTSRTAPFLDYAGSLRREEPVLLAALLAIAEKTIS